MKYGIIALHLVAMLFVTSPAVAQITTVTVRVDGLSCPFCAYSLEKQIKSVIGTKDPVINVEEGLVTLATVDYVPVDFEGLRDAVKDAGFTPRAISVQGVGRVATIDDRQVLVTEDGQPLFFLQPNDVLTGLAGAEHIVAFSGTVTLREKNEDAPLRTLALLSVSTHAKGDVN